MKFAFQKKTLDNITVVLIALEGLEKYFSQNSFESSAGMSLNRTMIPDSRKDKDALKYES